jgi:hypothetical protein
MLNWLRKLQAPRCGLCGHGASAHEHYREGTDCGLCACPKWRPR